jgi:hypothetical protein
MDTTKQAHLAMRILCSMFRPGRSGTVKVKIRIKIEIISGQAASPPHVPKVSLANIIPTREHNLRHLLSRRYMMETTTTNEGAGAEAD